jgi:hypothetical protein
MKTSKSITPSRKSKATPRKSVSPHSKKARTVLKPTENGDEEEYVYDEIEGTFVKKVSISDDIIEPDTEDRRP